MPQDANDSAAATLAAPATVAVPVAREAADLAARRQGLGLTIGDVAQRLKLSPRQIEALEAGRWTELPGMAFVRGALRGYGRLLDIDVAALLEAVGVHAEPLRSAMSLREPLPRRAVLADGPAGGRPLSLGRLVLALALLAALALYFGGGRDLSQVRSWIGVPASVPGETGADGDRTGSGPAATERPGSAPGAAATRVDIPDDPLAPLAPAGISGSGTTPAPLVPAAPPGGTSVGRRQ